jgi:hypothetical protein
MGINFLSCEADCTRAPITGTVPALEGDYKMLVFNSLRRLNERRQMADRLPLVVRTEVITIYLSRLGPAWDCLRERAEY